MDALEYLKSLPPNPLSPIIKVLGFIMPGVAYEVSMDKRGLDNKPLWAVTVARELEDGTCEIWHDKSEPFKSAEACKEYILELILELDPFDEAEAGRA